MSILLGEWIDKEIELPQDEERVLTYSPCYEKLRNGHEMTYRMMSGRFVQVCIDATHWARLNPPSTEKKE